MVESLRELNKLCQKPDYKTKGNWYVRTILRDAALPVTWLLLHTRITANQVTLISLAVSFAGMIFLATLGTGAFLVGVVLLQFWYYLDHVDGQIARYRGTACLTGRFLDFLTHHIVHTALFFAMGFYGYVATGSALFIVGGGAAALSILVFNVMHDVKYKTFFEKLEKEGGTILKKGDCLSEDVKRAVSLSKRIFAFAHKLCEVHVMMNILTIAALVQIFVKEFDFRIALFVAFALLATFIATVKLGFILKTGSIDREYRAIFDSPER